MDDGRAVQWTEIDGVAVVHGRDTGPLRASLVFRIGKVDEYLHANGITHLAEHLALFTLGQAPHYQNGSVRSAVTSFDTMGDAGQVIGFLAGICSALSSLPTDRIQSEVRVLEVEAGQRGRGPVDSLFTWRYGASDAGLWGFEEYVTHHVAAESLQAWASHVFTRGNCVLVLSGPPPEGLRLLLPQGGRIPPPALQPVLPQLPAQFQIGRPEICGLATVPRGVAAAAYAFLLRRRLVERLRIDLAVSYSPQVDYDPHDGDVAHVLVRADIHPDHVAAAAAGFHAVVCELADTGPTPQEVAEYVAESRQMRSMPETVGLAMYEAMSLLLGGRTTPYDSFWDELDALTPEQVRAPAVEVRDSMLYGVPNETSLPVDAVAVAPTSSLEEPVTGRRLTSLDTAAQGGSLVISPAGMTQTWPDGTSTTVRFSTCRATLAWPDGRRVLIGPDATAVTLEPTMWDDGRPVVGTIDRATAAVLVPMPERPVDDVPQPTKPSPAAGAPGRRQGHIVLLGALLVILLGLVAFLFFAAGPNDSSSVPGTLLRFLGLGAFLALFVSRGRKPKRRR